MFGRNDRNRARWMEDRLLAMHTGMERYFGELECRVQALQKEQAEEEQPREEAPCNPTQPEDCNLQSSQLLEGTILRVLDTTTGAKLSLPREGLYKVLSLNEDFVLLSDLTNLGLLPVKLEDLDGDDVLWEIVCHPPKSELSAKLLPTLSCDSVWDIQRIVERGILEFYIPESLAEQILLEGWKFHLAGGNAVSPKIRDASDEETTLPNIKILSLRQTTESSE